jgi:hypothetical protein
MQLCCEAFLVMIGREERKNTKESLAVSFQYVTTISCMIGICKITCTDILGSQMGLLVPGLSILIASVFSGEQ